MAVACAALALSGCGKKADDSGANTTAAVSGPASPAPAGGWTEQVAATPEGGFRMGNPDASVKLVEYGSLTCPHCADFDAEAMPTLRQWVGTGKLSYEYRNFVRDPYDLTAALIARCSGAGPFFKLTDQLYAAQKDWVGKAEQMSKQDIARIQAMPADKQAAGLAQVVGLDSFAAQRGIPSAKAQACLLDAKAQQALVDIRSAGTSKYNIQGTPTFILNGDVVEGADWASLKAKLQPLMGG
jgi:protein-disulfide isomerase